MHVCVRACVRACACAASAVDDGGANSPDLYPRLGAREVVPGEEESDPAEQKRLPAILLQRHETNCSGAERHNLSLHSEVGTAIGSIPRPSPSKRRRPASFDGEDEPQTERMRAFASTVYC